MYLAPSLGEEDRGITLPRLFLGASEVRFVGILEEERREGR